MNAVTSSTTYNGPASSWQFATYRINGKTVQLPVEVRGERITLQVAPYKP